MSVQVDLRVAQLLCSRLCHDLLSPSSAVNAGLELLGESGGGADDPAFDLLRTSAGEVRRRLEFFRLAFGGSADPGGEVGSGEARRLARELFAGARTALDWPPGDIPLSRDGARLLLNLVLLASESLPRRGTVAVRLAELDQGVGAAVAAEGDRAGLRAGAAAALAGDVDVSALDARSVQPYFTGCLARAAGARLEVAAGAARLELAAVLPRPPAQA